MKQKFFIVVLSVILFALPSILLAEEVQQNEMQDTSKILRDGQLFIIHEGKEYNANGMRIR